MICNYCRVLCINVWIKKLASGSWRGTHRQGLVYREARTVSIEKLNGDTRQHTATTLQRHCNITATLHSNITPYHIRAKRCMPRPISYQSACAISYPTYGICVAVCCRELYILSYQPNVLSTKPHMNSRKSSTLYQKSFTLYQKSLAMCQKSPTFYQQSPSCYLNSFTLYQHSPTFNQKEPSMLYNNDIPSVSYNSQCHKVVKSLLQRPTQPEHISNRDQVK